MHDTIPVFGQALRKMISLLLSHPLYQEWELSARRRAQQKGVSLFEEHCAREKLPLSFQTLSLLYDEPEALEIIEDEGLRRLARAMIQKVVLEEEAQVYKEMFEQAKNMASLAEGGGKTGGLLSLLKKFIPLPWFFK